MKCSKCGADVRSHSAKSRSVCLETRTFDGAVYRRRSCGHCGETFVTKEAATPGLRMPPKPAEPTTGTPQRAARRAPPKQYSNELFNTWK